MGEAAFIGRFQPFHNGHRKTVEKFRASFSRLTVVIGSPGEGREEENPFTSAERREMIENCFPSITVRELEDVGDEEEWAGKVEELDAETIISNNDHVKSIVEQKTSKNLETYDMFSPSLYSGTEIRRRIRSGEEWRYLVPECAAEAVDGFEEIVRKTGHSYEFEPGWEPRQ